MNLKKHLGVWLTVAGLGLSFSSIAAQSHHGEGTVKTIDMKERKIELDHGPIKSIGWMAMKMFFDVEDRELLEEVEVGDQVEFEFVKTGDGRFVVTDIELKD